MESLGSFLDGEWESICKMFTTDEVEPDFTMELLLGDHHHHHQSLTSGMSDFTTNPDANLTPTTAFTTSIFDQLGFGVDFGNSEAFSTNLHDACFSPSRQGYTSTTTSSDQSGGGGGTAFLPASTCTDDRRYPVENYYGYDRALASSSMDHCMMEQNGGSHMMASGIASTIYDLQNMMDYEVMDPTNNKSSASSSSHHHIIHPANNADEDHSPPSSTTIGLEAEEKNAPIPVPKKRGRATKDGQKGKKKRKQSCATPSRDLQEEEENKNNRNGGGVADKNNNNNSSCDVQMNSDNESNVSDEAINGEENDEGKEIHVAAVKKRASRGAATDPQSLYARRRRERINERLRILQNLVPNGTKVDISTMLEEAVHYVKFLQLQIKLLSSDEMWMYAPLAYNGVDVSLHRKFSPFML